MLFTSAIAPFPFQRDLFGLALASLVMVTYLHGRRHHPLLWLAVLWLRRLSLIFGGLCLVGGLGLSSAPTVLLVPTLTIAIFFLESFLVWIRVCRLEFNSMVPFIDPRPLREENLWPNSSQWLGVQNRLEKHDFKFEAAAVRTAEGAVLFLILVFRSTELRTRLSIHFPLHADPESNGAMFFISRTSDGGTVITTNFRPPFAGFYPSDWSVRRLPLRQNFSTLLKIHLERLREDALVVPADDPVDQLRHLSEDLRRTNLEAGFLLQDMDGEISLTGLARYRLWKETLLLGHIGRPLS